MAYPRILSRDVARYTPLHSHTTKVDIKDISGYAETVKRKRKNWKNAILGAVGLIAAAVFITHAVLQSIEIRDEQNKLLVQNKEQERKAQSVLIERDYQEALANIRAENAVIKKDIEWVDDLIIGKLLTKEYCSADVKCKAELLDLKRHKESLEVRLVHEG